MEGVIDVHCASQTSQGVPHRVFCLDGHPSRYQPCPTGLNFGEETETGVSPLVIAVPSHKTWGKAHDMSEGTWHERRYVTWVKMIMIMRSIYIMLYSTNTQSDIHGLMGDFFMAQVAADTILIIKNKVGFNRCPQYRKSNRPQHRELHILVFSNSEWDLQRPSQVLRDGTTNLITICRCHYKGSTFSSVIWSWFELHAGRQVVLLIKSWMSRKAKEVSETTIIFGTDKTIKSMRLLKKKLGT